MIVTKKLKCLEKIVSSDALRAVLTGVHYVPDKHMFEATDGQVLIRFFPNKEEYDIDEYPTKHMPFELKPFEEECIISPDIFDVVKGIKNSKNKPIVDGTMILSDRDEDSVATFTNGIQMPSTAFPRKILGVYPKTDSMFATKEEFVVRKQFNYKLFTKLLSAIKEIANPATGSFYIDVPVSNKPAVVGCEDSNTGNKLEGLIMPQNTDTENQYALKVLYRVRINYTDGTAETFREDFNNAKFTNVFAAINFAQDREGGLKDSPTKVESYKVSAEVHGEYMATEWPPKIEEPDPEPELTDEEKEALNELTDGDCCSDSADDTMDKCQEADDCIEEPEPEEDPYPNHGKRWSIEDEEKLEFLYKAGKTIEDLSEIFGRKQDGIVKRLEKMGLIEQSKPFFSEGGYEPPKKEEVPEENTCEEVTATFKTLKVKGWLKSGHFDMGGVPYAFKLNDMKWPTTSATDVERLRIIVYKNADAMGVDTTKELKIYEEGREEPDDLHVVFNVPEEHYATVTNKEDVDGIDAALKELDELLK